MAIKLSLIYRRCFLVITAWRCSCPDMPQTNVLDANLVIK